MRCVVMLASDFGMDCFDAVDSIKEVEVVGIVTPKEKYELKYGRGCSKEMANPIFCALLQKCQEKNIPVFVMEKMNSQDTIQRIKEWKPELIIVSGWYHMIGNTILDMPTKGVIGLHSSMLPRYRGGAPLVWQIINDEKKAGISLFYMDEGTDTGDIIAQKQIKIENLDTIATLYDKVKKEGIALLRECLPLIAINKAPRIQQIGLSDKDIYPQRRPEDGRIDWSRTSRQIYNFVRAQTKPYPGAYTYYQKYKVIIWSCEILQNEYIFQEEGVILDIVDDSIVASTGELNNVIIIKDYIILAENDWEIDADQGFFKLGERFGLSVAKEKDK